MNTIFNKRTEYESLIEEKVMELKKLCHIHRIPIFITVCVENTADKTLYEKEMISAATCGYEIADDQIAKHVNVTLGFDTIQPSSDMDIDMDDVGIDDLCEDDNEGVDEDAE